MGFRQHYPGTDLRLEMGNTAQVAVAMRAGAAEVGFVEGAVQNPSLGWSCCVVAPVLGWFGLPPVFKPGSSSGKRKEDFVGCDCSVNVTQAQPRGVAAPIHHHQATQLQRAVGK